MRQYDTILFDLDGTVLDTSSGILRSIDEAIMLCGLPEITPEQKRSMIGPPIDRSFKAIYGMTDEQAKEAAAAFRTAYSGKYLMDAQPYPGILELMEQLRRDGWKLGVATYKRNDYAQRLMQETGINDLCHFTLGSDGKDQTKADIIRICPEQLGCVDPARCIMVGDTVHDLTGAQNAGTAFAGVTFGFGFVSREEIMEQGALIACGSAMELGNALKGIGEY